MQVKIFVDNFDLGCSVFAVLRLENFVFLYPCKTNVFGTILESACLSILVSVCVQNTTFCQRAGRVIKSHSVTDLVDLAVFGENLRYCLGIIIVVILIVVLIVQKL